MNSNIEKHFKDVGAVAVVREIEPRTTVRGQSWPNSNSIRIAEDKKHGEVFRIAIVKGDDLIVRNKDAKDRHILVQFKSGGSVLCGHDERHWFQAAVAGSPTTVKEAKAQLLPPEIREATKGKRKALKRRNEVYVRQGEWIFRPVKNVPDGIILKNERLQRDSRSKPHMVDELMRGTSGTNVWVSGSREIGQAEYDQLLAEFPNRARLYRSMRRTNEVYARGKVRHPDHKTVVLDGWHRVYLNTERFAQTARMGFLD